MNVSGDELDLLLRPFVIQRRARWPHKSSQTPRVRSGVRSGVSSGVVERVARLFPWVCADAQYHQLGASPVS